MLSSQLKSFANRSCESCELRQVKQDAMVFVCTNVEQIPDEARAVAGRLSCPQAEEPEILLEGGARGAGAVELHCVTKCCYYPLVN